MTATASALPIAAFQGRDAIRHKMESLIEMRLHDCTDGLLRRSRMGQR